MYSEIFISKFDDLIQGPCGVKKIRELALSLAIRGLLVSKNDKEGDAKSLYKKIQLERNSQVASGDIRRQKSYPSPVPEALPHSIPDRWVLCSIGNIAHTFNGNSISKNEKESEFQHVSDGYNYIATKDVIFETRSIEYDTGIKTPFNDDRFRIAKKNAVLICSEGGSAGKKIAVTRESVSFGNKLYAIEFFEGVDSRFASYVFQSREFFEAFSKVKTGIIGGVSLERFRQLPFLLPPIEEQKRIVSRLNRIFELCYQLDSLVSEGEQLNETFLGSLIHKISEPHYTPVKGPDDGGGEGGLKGRPKTSESKSKKNFNSQVDAEVHTRMKRSANAMMSGSNQSTGENAKFKEAVLVGAMVKIFFNEGGVPLGNFRIQKGVYFARRYMGEVSLDQEFLRKAAGPYSPSMKFSGGIRIAKDKNFIREARSRFGFGHVVGENVTELMTWANRYENFWEAVTWVRDTFMYRKNDEWELLATVDYVYLDLTANDIEATPENVLNYIRVDEEWHPKIRRLRLTNRKIRRSLREVRKLFGSEG